MLNSKANNMQTATQAQVLQALQNAIAAAFPAAKYSTGTDGRTGVYIGYNSLLPEAARVVIPAAIEALQGENVQWDNLHTTTGSEDTVVQFTVNNVATYICTTYS